MCYCARGPLLYCVYKRMFPWLPEVPSGYGCIQQAVREWAEGEGSVLSREGLRRILLRREVRRKLANRIYEAFRRDFPQPP